MANKYWISYRIHEDTKVNYEKRYDALIQYLTDNNTGVWNGTTSFVLLQSDLAIGALASGIKTKINSSMDHVLIRYIDNSSAVSVGKCEDRQTLQGFMPYVSFI